jgi:hypothetical protein
MQIDDQQQINGLPQYLYYGQMERVEELNNRMTSRQFSDSPLQPNFDPRPVPTKYSHFPIVNRRTPMKEPVIPYLDYNLSANFNPGSSKAPPSGFINNVETENRLRNQYFALQHGADQGIYIPSSNSDLYRVSVPIGQNNDPQPHPELFERPQFDPTPNPNVASSNIGRETFYNHTRTQLRGGL